MGGGKGVAGISSCFSVSLLSCKISKIPRFPGLQVFSSLSCSRIVLLKRCKVLGFLNVPHSFLKGLSDDLIERPLK